MKLKRRLIGLLAVALLAACGDAVEPVAAPQPAALQGSSPLRLVKAKSSSNNAVTVLVDRQGGVLVDSANGHALEIPRGAVSEPTYFVMGTLASDNYVVKLLAYKASDLSVVKDFSTKPLKLRMNYGAAEIASPRRLKIVYVSNDLAQILEVLTTSISKTSTVIEASITHFSIYSMAID
jgi:hypothetical protein